MEGHQTTLREGPRSVEVSIDGVVVASSGGAVVLAETGLPPRYYLPRDDVRMDLLEATPTETVCPFKGQAAYWSVRTTADGHRDIAWSYGHPAGQGAGVPVPLRFHAQLT